LQAAREASELGVASGVAEGHREGGWMLALGDPRINILSHDLLIRTLRLIAEKGKVTKIEIIHIKRDPKSHCKLG
jgi:hypothetical protein